MTLSRRDAMVRMATLASVLVSGFLVCLKLVAWIRSDSLSLQATVVDSFLDIFASLVNFVAVRQALKPADKEHRFGHGKIEALAALLQSTFIAGSSLWLMMESIKRFLHPEPVTETTFGIIVMVISIVLTLGLVIFQRHVIRHYGSTAVKADYTHYVGDILVNFCVIVALLSNHLPWGSFLDPLVGLFIAFYICYAAWKISKESVDMLIDRELPDEDRHQIIALIRAQPDVKGYHDLRTRSSGAHRFIQFHLELEPHLSLVEAHAISDRVGRIIEEAFPHSEVIIHEDPYDPHKEH